MDNIIVTILGQSGTGKSTSIRNLDPKTTAIISTDGKPLPIKGASKFKALVRLDDGKPEAMMALLKRVKDNDEIKVVVIDAFTQWSEKLMYHCNQKFRNYERQNNYNNAVFEFWNELPNLKGKQVYVFAHPTIGETFDGDDAVVAKVENKLRRGIIEQLSTVLLMARANKTEQGIEYVFETQTNGRTPAKSPMGLFEELSIDNDLSLVSKAITEYYK
jgi:hypothetical protein